MIYAFGSISRQRLSTCEPKLVHLAQRVLNRGIMDLHILCGLRSRAQQEEAFLQGFSTKRWPYSTHNTMEPDGLSRAVDIAPFINGRVSYKPEHCCVMAGLLLSQADIMGIGVRWGGNWDQDGEPITDQGFNDLVHFELI